MITDLICSGVTPDEQSPRTMAKIARRFGSDTSPAFDQLVHWANRAMLEAKAKGKKQVVFYGGS